MKIVNWEEDFLYYSVPVIKTVKSVSDRMSYTVLRVHWCNIVLNVHAASEEKSDDSKDGFYEELEQVFLSFS